MVARRDERITRLALSSANRGGRLKTGEDAPQFVETIKVDLIDPDPSQPRRHFDEQKLRELGESIRESGQIQPIVVVKNGDRFTLHVGERRWRASKLLGLATIRALVRASPLEARQALIAQIVENEQRVELTTTELVDAVCELAHHGLRKVDIARELAKSPSRVSELLALSEAPAELKAIADAVGLSLSYQLLRQWRAHPAETLEFVANVPVEHIGRFTISTIGQPPPDRSDANSLDDYSAGSAEQASSSITATAIGREEAAEGGVSAASNARSAEDHDPPPANACDHIGRDPEIAGGRSRVQPSTAGSMIVEHPEHGAGDVVFDEAVPPDHLAVAFGDRGIVIAHKDAVLIKRIFTAPTGGR